MGTCSTRFCTTWRAAELLGVSPARRKPARRKWRWRRPATARISPRPVAPAGGSESDLVTEPMPLKAGAGNDDDWPFSILVVEA